MPEKKKKKETTFIEKEGGMIYQSEDGSALAVGFPSEIETLTAREGKGGVSIKGVSGELKGESYRKVKYNWHVISQKELSSTDVKTYTEAITNASGTLAASFHVTQPPFVYYPKCPKCSFPNPPSTEACRECGTSLENGS